VGFRLMAWHSKKENGGFSLGPNPPRVGVA
jgi:hypothetical protein